VTPGIEMAAVDNTAVVAIDGPSGSGKSTVARLLADRLGCRYLDTGAMYRAVTWAVLRAGVPTDDVDAVAAVAQASRLQISTDPQNPGISLDGVGVDRQIRTAGVTAAVSAVASVPAVRTLLVALQRRLIGAGAIVVEGRDIGTVVAPQACLKVYLTAASAVRAGRRRAEIGTASADEVAADLSRRDGLDSTRALSPLAPAGDAVVLDTSELGIEDVVARLSQLVHQRTGVDRLTP